MKNNIGKIKKLREELKEVIDEYNSIDSDFDLSTNIELLNEEAKELNQILSFLDTENSELLKKIEFLKEDVNRRIQKLASENPFQTILKKFQKVYGKDCFNVSDLNDFFDSQYKNNSVSSKNFELKKVKGLNEQLNLLFEEEIKKIKSISSNKQDFIENNFDGRIFSSYNKEEKLFYIFSKIDELKERFQINLDFELSKNSDEVDSQINSLLVSNIIDVVSKGYDDLKNEFTKKVSWDEFVEKESDFNKGKTFYDKKIGSFKNLISNANLLENKYQKRLTDLFNSPAKNKFIELINKQELDFNSYQNHLKKLFDSLYSTNYSLFKVKFDLSLNSYLKFIESIEVQIENIEKQNSSVLSENKENFLLTGKEKDFSVEVAYYDQLCEISKKFIAKLTAQKEIIDNYSEILIPLIDSVTFDCDYEPIISKITYETKQFLQLVKDVFESLKDELKNDIKTLKQTLHIDKDSQIYIASQQIIDLLNKGIATSEKNLINDLEEYLEQSHDFFKDFLSKKIDLIEERLSATENFETNNNKFFETAVNKANVSSFENKNDSNIFLISLINKKIENLEDKFANFANVLESINNKLNKKDNDNTNKNYIDEISKNINGKFEELLQNLKVEMNSVSENNQNFVTGLIESNNREREYITDLLQKIDSEYQNTLDELESRVIVDSSRKLQTLEDLIILQNNELEELLDDRNNVINVIEKAINQKIKNPDDNPIRLEKTISEISKNFESRIDNLESRFSDKLQEIHVDSLTLASTDNDLYRELSRNISGLESQLINNYESVKNSFKESFTDLINKIGYGNQSDYNEILNRKIDELNVLVESLKEKNEISFQTLEENLRALSKNDISQILESFDDKIESISEKIESKVDWYESNRQEELNNLSEKIGNQLKYLMNDIHNDRLEDNQRFVDQIIKNNENEKQYIISLLNKMNEERLNPIDENNLARVMENNRRLQDLKDLILLQNNELQELLDDKNNAINEIENVILKNKEKLIKNGDSYELKNGISKIIEKFDNKIVGLENNLEEKFAKIGSFTTDGAISREVLKSMSELENKLLENYESIKNSFRESFQDIENWVLSIATDKDGNYSATPKLNKILDAINDLKNSSVNFNSDKFYGNISTTLLNELSKFSLNQYALFENLEKNILGAIDKKVFESIMDEFDYRLKELIEQISSRNAESLKEIENKLISTNSDFESFAKMDKNAITRKLNESLESYQSLLEKSLENVNNNYLNLKDLVQKILDKDRGEFTASELKKIVSLESKFNNLEKLVALQDEQTNALLNEKDSLLAKLVSLLNQDSQDLDDVLRIISVIDEKVKKFSDVLSDNLEITKNISKGSVFNETSQVSDRVDALSQYLKTVSNKLDLLNLDYENIWMLNEIKNFGNLEFIHSKLNTLMDEIQSISDKSNTDVQVIKKLDQIKLDLLSIENDLKLIRISVNSNNESDIKEFNIKKSDFIANLIKENKILINNLLKEKESLVKSVTEKAIFDNSISELQKNNLEILLQGKAGIIFEIIFKEIQKIQEQNIINFNTKLNELKNKLAKDYGWKNNEDCDPFAFAVDKKLLDKIEVIEKNIHTIFNQIDEKKNNFLNGIDSKVSDNEDLVKKIVSKFDKEKESLTKTHERKRKELRDLIINFKNSELNSYRKKLASLDLQIKNLKNSPSLENDDSLVDFENSVDQGREKLSLLEDLIENLTFEINSFDEEKRAMFEEIENKINYLDDLNDPLKDGLIELESDNWNSDKFKNIVSKEAQDIINSKFQELKKDCDFNIQKIEETINDLKNIHNQLSEIDKKLSDNTTLDKRIDDLESLVFEPVKNAEDQNNKKISNYHLELIDDNVKFYVDELEKKKIEIANFYRKVRNLAASRERK